MEREVLERVGLGADRGAVVLRVERNTARERPRGERALVLEPQVPVQAGGRVLLDDEARGGRIGRDAERHRQARSSFRSRAWRGSRAGGRRSPMADTVPRPRATRTSVQRA